MRNLLKSQACAEISCTRVAAGERIRVAEGSCFPRLPRGVDMGICEGMRVCRVSLPQCAARYLPYQRISDV
eukprot:4103271-Pleurochrysis_carterae.AAC.2